MSVEDPMAEDDAVGMARFTAAVGRRVQIIGDDYPRDQRRAGASEAAAQRACNAVLIKPNQAGTITETKAALDAGRARRIRHHRLGALGRNRGCHHRASGASAGMQVSSRSARSRAPSAWRSGMRRCVSKRRSVASARFAGRDVLTAAIERTA